MDPVGVRLVSFTRTLLLTVHHLESSIPFWCYIKSPPIEEKVEVTPSVGAPLISPPAPCLNSVHTLQTRY